MRTSILFAIVALSSACSSEPAALEIKKSINMENFPGLESLGANIGEVKLDYDLDGTDGSLVHFSSCEDVRSIEQSSIREEQFPLLSMLRLNCEALELYTQAKNSSVTYLPKKLSSEFIQSLPTEVTPNLGGEKTHTTGNSISQAYRSFTAKELEPTVIQAELDDLTINFTELARGDFDSDGREDILLRLDWANRVSFGKGYELKLISSREQDSRLIKTP